MGSLKGYEANGPCVCVSESMSEIDESSEYRVNERSERSGRRGMLGEMSEVGKGMGRKKWGHTSYYP